MKARMTNPAFVLEGAMQRLQALGAVVDQADLPPTTIQLVELRASQINGCSVCVDGHAKLLRKLGDNDDRIIGVSAWREMPYFNDAERAALALAECVTRLADRPDPVPDDVWDEAARHYDEKGLAGLILAVASVNVWNRLNAATRQPAGHWKP